MLRQSIHDGILTMRLDRGKANALDRDLLERLAEALDGFARDDALRAAVLTGTGSIFCAGVDLYRVLDGGAEYARAFVPVLAGTFHRLFACPKPIVAAINGHAIAGGCVLAAACDYRLMASGDGTIGVPELTVGVPFPLVAIEILRFATSTAHLQDLVYRGTTYSTSAACERGLVDEVVAPDELADRAVTVARRLASEPAARFRLTKQQLRAPTIATIAAHAAETDAAVLAEWERPETVAAIRAYLDGRRRR
ncbi:MAG: enoyl-CoA hydratase/isomerase family protein [Gemmatimonadota bacterium]|nr:enoyl-CoA hydratase/isomerase family protein [Gemmatimonadota bacterium]MDH5197769.1 enoyl-CoA hydratase/isomerase family protein [Gemmatimonadota bacterium]